MMHIKGYYDDFKQKLLQLSVSYRRKENVSADGKENMILALTRPRVMKEEFVGED
jgi:hypothetical protein